MIKAETGNHTDYERMCATMAVKTSIRCSKQNRANGIKAYGVCQNPICLFWWSQKGAMWWKEYG